MVTTDTRTTTPSELREHLSHFNLSWLLRSIGKLSADLGDQPAVVVDGIPVTAHCLAYLALVGIEAASDDVLEVPASADLAEAARIFNGLRDPPFTSLASDPRVFEYLIRMGYSQFGERDDLRNLIARTWMLYETLWAQVEKAAQFDVANAIASETGLNLRQLLMFGFAYSGHAEAGYMTPYGDDGLAKLPSELGAGLEEQARFLRWVTATYDEIRQLGTRELPDEAYAKYRLSPFLLKPVVCPDRPPVAGAERVRLVPVPRYLARRVTDGLYHALATVNATGDRTNVFRSAFGFAFEAYVGELLRAGSAGCTVLGDREYGPKRARVKSPDWFVLDSDRLVVVEVKQSALTLNTKMIGRTDMLATDLRKTLGAGARQLLKFREDLRAGVAGLEDFRGVQRVELLLVTHDDVPFANWVMRETIAKELPDVADVHFCSIDDLENLQRYTWRESPFDLLEGKRLGDKREYDFREWLYELGSPRTEDHPVLAAELKRLVSSWGVSPDRSAA